MGGLRRQGGSNTLRDGLDPKGRPKGGLRDGGSKTSMKAMTSKEGRFLRTRRFLNVCDGHGPKGRPRGEQAGGRASASGVCPSFFLLVNTSTFLGNITRGEVKRDERERSRVKFVRLKGSSPPLERKILKVYVFPTILAVKGQELP